MHESLEQRPLNWEHYWALALRRRWWLMGPFFGLGLLAFLAALLWPQLYRSEALVLVEQQKVPEQYVMPNVVTDPQDRLQSMTQQILSRTRLRRLIEQFNLYPRERARMTMDEVIDLMRDRIRIELVRAPGRPAELTAFRIYYSADNARVAQQITNELTSLFIEENLQARTQQSAGTTSFLESQLEKARKELAEQEERQRQYKLRFLGQLPEQQQSNLQILGSLEAQMRASTTALERAEQQKVYLESMDAEYGALRQSLQQTQAAAAGAAASAAPPAQEATVHDLRRQLTDLETKYTPKHPDVVKLRDELERWEGLKKQAQGESAAGSPERAATVTAADTAAIEVQSRLKAVGVEIASHNKDVDELRQRIRQFQSRLEMAPVREQQLAEVTRSYENSRQYYQSLLQKKLQSELATNLEKRQQGEQFRILDPASLPQKPSRPDRLQITLFGWLLGLCLGVVLTAAREITDNSVRGEEELQQAVRLLVLVRIPLLRTEEQERRWQLRRRLEAAGVGLLLLLAASTGLYTYLAS